MAEDQTVHSHSQHGDTRFFLDWDAKTQSVVLFASKNQVLLVCLQYTQLLFLLHNPKVPTKSKKKKASQLFFSPLRTKSCVSAMHSCSFYFTTPKFKKKNKNKRKTVEFLRWRRSRTGPERRSSSWRFFNAIWSQRTPFGCIYAAGRRRWMFLSSPSFFCFFSFWSPAREGNIWSSRSPTLGGRRFLLWSFLVVFVFNLRSNRTFIVSIFIDGEHSGRVLYCRFCREFFFFSLDSIGSPKQKRSNPLTTARANGLSRRCCLPKKKTKKKKRNRRFVVVHLRRSPSPLRHVPSAVPFWSPSWFQGDSITSSSSSIKISGSLLQWGSDFGHPLCFLLITFPP